VSDNDAIAQLEADIDRRMREKMPDAYARMLEARQERNGFEQLPDLSPAGDKLGDGPPKPRERVVKVAPAPSDAEVEAVLGALVGESFAAAIKSFQLAREATTVELRDLHAHQAARLTKACGEVATALMRSRGKCDRVVVQYIKGSQVVGLVNK
jgi:hypothetical protein